WPHGVRPVARSPSIRHAFYESEARRGRAGSMVRPDHALRREYLEVVLHSRLSFTPWSLYADHHFTKRFDAFAGIAYFWVSGGLAVAIPHGPGVPYYHNNNVAPTIGARFAF